MKKTVIICGFPGVGKTFLFEKNKDGVLDSDSSHFSWSDKKKKIRNPIFPHNYIEHIRENIGQVDIMLVSSHKVVREALVDRGIKFTLVYPSIDMKDEYIQRFVDRGNDKSFIKLLKANYEKWIKELIAQKDCVHTVLKRGQYLADVLTI